MANNVIDRDLGWRRILQEVEKANNRVVAVGLFEGKKNANGANIAEYAAANEFGANIKIAARSQQQYRSINKDGSFRNSGRFSKKGKSNFSSWATIGAHEVNIPERPFMRTSFDENIGQINADVNAETAKLVTGKTTAHRALTTIGLKHKARVQNTITGRNFLPKLSPQTIKQKKGSTKTLVDSGAMVNAVTIELRNK